MKAKENAKYCTHTSGFITIQIIDGEYWCVHCNKPLKNK